MNIPTPTKIGSNMGGAPTPKWDPMGFDDHGHMADFPLGAMFVPGPNPKTSHPPRGDPAGPTYSCAQLGAMGPRFSGFQA